MSSFLMLVPACNMHVPNWGLACCLLANKSSSQQTPTRHLPNTNQTPTRHQPGTNQTPTGHQPDSSQTAARHQPDTNQTSTRHQPDTDVVNGKLDPHAFPPVEAVMHEGRLWVVRGNRRLFVFRVFATLGAVQSMSMVLLPSNSKTMQVQRWDTRLGRFASKWDRSFSSTNGGQWVRVDSQSLSLQDGH